MTTINKALYDALRAANVADDLASAASAPEDLKQLQSDLSSLRDRLNEMSGQMKILLLLNGVMLAGILGILFRGMS